MSPSRPRTLRRRPQLKTELNGPVRNAIEGFELTKLGSGRLFERTDEEIATAKAGGKSLPKFSGMAWSCSPPARSTSISPPGTGPSTISTPATRRCMTRRRRLPPARRSPSHARPSLLARPVNAGRALSSFNAENPPITPPPMAASSPDAAAADRTGGGRGARPAGLARSLPACLSLFGPDAADHADDAPRRHQAAGFSRGDRRSRHSGGGCQGQGLHRRSLRAGIPRSAGASTPSRPRSEFRSGMRASCQTSRVVVTFFATAT